MWSSSCIFFVARVFLCYCQHPLSCPMHHLLRVLSLCPCITADSVCVSYFVCCGALIVLLCSCSPFMCLSIFLLVTTFLCLKYNKYQSSTLIQIKSKYNARRWVLGNTNSHSIYNVNEKFDIHSCETLFNSSHSCETYKCLEPWPLNQRQIT